MTKPKDFLRPYYDRIFSLIYSKKKTLEIEYEDYNFLFSTNSKEANDWFFPRYRKGQLHEPEISKLLIEHLEEDDIFYDVGSHVGYYSVLAAEICREGKIYCFEIDPDLIPSIENYIDLNSFQNIKIVNSAVSDKSGEFVGFEPRQEENLSTNEITSSGTTLLQTISLSDFAAIREKPNFVKIDVEGNERKVLDGLFREEDMDSLEYLLVEIHPENLSSEDLENTSKTLHSRGFEIKEIEHRKQDTDSYSIRDLSELEENKMIFCSR